ncbi:hypothetical protein GOP47_0016414 [Adiantum capillus-veneris]|uniref:Large ribosomal RNA subunit accumulation protein YCED homolog 1, chloroplastic n=1 Tax=Adiantum capillus-veneris TaxID=13818 RepID=A0A9D4UIG2_ADICA|nr:hypothetical protein GOP47_0016414 [Adiantum capillus-veneris]
MDFPLTVFTARQSCKSLGYEVPSSRATPPLIRSSCRMSSSSKHWDVSTSRRKNLCRAMFSICSCERSSSLYRFHPPLHTPPRSALRVFAVDSSSPSSSDASEVEREEGMPVPGTITYRRSATQKHYEYFTDLETLGMESFSSELSRSMALSMGITESPMSKPNSTPASVSIDVKREGRDLRLDGIARTALALKCARCGVPVAERVFGEFSLLLTEQPVVEPSKHRVGVILGGGQPMAGEEEDIEDVLDLDLDDKMHFPKSEKTIDISKYIRDTVHLEIPLQSLCSLSCKGRCIECGVNFNKNSCNCATKANNEDRRQRWSALEKLKEQLDQEGR